MESKEEKLERLKRKRKKYTKEINKAEAEIDENNFKISFLKRTMKIQLPLFLVVPLTAVLAGGVPLGLIVALPFLGLQSAVCIGTKIYQKKLEGNNKKAETRIAMADYNRETITDTIRKVYQENQRENTISVEQIQPKRRQRFEQIQHEIIPGDELFLFSKSGEVTKETPKQMVKRDTTKYFQN